MTSSSTTSPAESAEAPRRGHPRGLYTLFFTEMWERFSYYGMRALLVLFMVDAVKNGGMGLDDKLATSIYGLYTASVYLAALAGGWIADRFLGAQRSVWYGGMIIAAGHFTLAIPRTECFFLGLVLVVVGTGLLKPNVSVMVGQLYPEGGARCDAGFSIFYMGINLGAFVGPLITGSLAARNWHYGFAAAGVGMVLGLIQYRFTVRYLGEAGRHPGHRERVRPRDKAILAVLLGGLFLGVGLPLAGVVRLNPVILAQGTKWVILTVAVVYFACVFCLFDLEPTEKKRVVVIVVLFLAAAMFFSGFEQAGSSFNLFAERYTRRILFGREFPAAWFQSLGPVFVITLAPLMAALWPLLARRHLEPSLPVKFSLGLILLGAGFLVMAAASVLVARGRMVGLGWLSMTYLIHTFGELCLSPVGLSSVTKLAPRRLVGQMMGTWFLAASFGNLIAGQIAGDFNANAVGEFPGRYMGIVLTTAGTGLVLLLFTKPIKRLMAGIH